ncbi:MAG TPA: hypothetical protein VMT88_03160 [Actinomycetes bacterium]|nr:hypothetical protein [Actinomycetes bacterium]
MAPPIVYLHVGSPKTGTTYIQNVLWVNREALQADGVLLPGHYRYARVQATRDLLKWTPDDSPQPPRSWQRIAAEINRWSGRSTIFSMEFLSWASADQAQAIVASVPDSQIKVVLTTRDLARQVPAQWQTAMRQRNTWTLDEYADAVAGVSTGKQARDASRHFWRRQDYGKILAHWGEVVGVENLTVVTVPPSGGDPSELWHRFCQATDLVADQFKTTDASHESLGAASTEVMRRLNQTTAINSMTMRSYQKSVNGALSRRVLSSRRSQEPGLTLPTAHTEWAAQEATRLIDEIKSVGAELVGDLADLNPTATAAAPLAPEQLPAEQLLAAAIDGLAGLAVEHAKLREKFDDLEATKTKQAARIKAPLQAGGIKGLRQKWLKRSPRS